MKLKALRCRILGHKWQNAKFSYYMCKDKIWIHKVEPALHCQVCGKFTTLYTEYNKSILKQHGSLCKEV